MTYSEKLKDPRWQKKRLEIFERDGWECKLCGSKTNTLHVHHFHYNSHFEPWEMDNKYLLTLCEKCHERETEEFPEATAHLARVLQRCCFLSHEAHKLASLIDGIIVPLYRDKELKKEAIKEAKTELLKMLLSFAEKIHMGFYGDTRFLEGIKNGLG